MGKTATLFIATAAVFIRCGAVRSRASEGVHCATEPAQLKLAFILPHDGQTCSDHADAYARELEGSYGLTCGVIRTEADCRVAAGFLQAPGSPDPVFTATSFPTKALPGWCSVAKMLESPLRVNWNNDTDEVPAGKVGRIPTVDLEGIPVCGCYPLRLCDVPVRGTAISSGTSVASAGAKVKSAAGIGGGIRAPLTEGDFEHNSFDFRRVKLQGSATNAAILAACQALNMRPVCDHAGYADGRCEIAGGNGSAWHFSLPAHNNEFGVPVEKTTGAYFYTGAGREYPLQNTGSSHRWADAKDSSGGSTFCVSPQNSRDFRYELWTLVRARVNQSMTGTQMNAVCAGLGMRPVCDHAHYLDGRCIIVGGAWHFSHPDHDAENRVPLGSVQGAFFYAGRANNGLTLLNTGSSHRWSSEVDQFGDTFCTKPMRTYQSFEYRGYLMYRTEVVGEMSADNIFKTCAKDGLRPVCDHAHYVDGRCVIVGGAWHFSSPSHNAENGVLLHHVKGAYFYAGNANGGLSLANHANTHQWAPAWHQDGDTFCVKPRREALSLSWSGYVLNRVVVNGTMNSANIRAACQDMGMRPVCDHAHYLDGICVVAGGAWHFSYPTHGEDRGVPVDRLEGAFFYAGSANKGLSLVNIATAHRWSDDKSQLGDTFCATPRRAEQTFSYNGYTMQRVAVSGEMNSENIFQACSRAGLRPVCDHAHYFDGRCVIAGGAWHFSHPEHDAANKVPLDKVKGAYFYAGFANEGRSLANLADTHRWSAADQEGDTFCVAPRREALSFTWSNFSFRRTEVRGAVNSASIRAACEALGGGFQPLCDHAAYNDGKCVAFGPWHFSLPQDAHACGKVPDCKVLAGAYFYAGAANNGLALENIATTHRWSDARDQDGDTYCVKRV